MLARIREWVRHHRSFRADHEAAWGPVREPGPDGFSQHLVSTEALVTVVLRERGLALVKRQVHVGQFLADGPREARVEAEVPELGATLHLYCDQTDIVAPNYEYRLEQWDTRTPERHLELVAEAVRRLPLV